MANEIEYADWKMASYKSKTFNKESVRILLEDKHHFKAMGSSKLTAENFDAYKKLINDISLFPPLFCS